MTSVLSRSDSTRLVDQFELGLDAPICLTWELTYACNLACVHCLSSSGRRDPRELTTEQCKAVIDELERMQVFYVNIGGGEPTVRPDFWELVDYATAHNVGVKFSTNGVRITPPSRPGSPPATTSTCRSRWTAQPPRSTTPCAAPAPSTWPFVRWRTCRAGFTDFKISVVVTRHNVDQLDEFKALADRYGATLRITRLRPSGRGADVWDELHPTAAQQRQLYDWLVANGDGVLTGDSFFHLSAFGESFPGLNLCGAGRVVCLIDPVGDVYACPFAIHEQFLAGNILRDGGFDRVWRDLRTVHRTSDTDHRRCLRQVRAFRRVPGRLYGRQVLHRAAVGRTRPRMCPGIRRIALSRPTARCPSRRLDHSRSLPLTVLKRPGPGVRREPACRAAVEERLTWPETVGSRPSPRRSAARQAAATECVQRAGRRLGEGHHRR